MEIQKETRKLAFGAGEREKSLRSKTKNSLSRFHRAQRTLAGGVSSSFRKLARPYPLYYREGHGSRVTDVDGNTYLDYGLAWGPLILGHSPADVVNALKSQLRAGSNYGGIPGN